MKRINIYLSSILLVLATLTFQSCSDDSVTPVTFKAPVVSSPSPADESSIEMAGASMDITLTWSATEGTYPAKWDVYFGTDPANLQKVSSQQSTTSFTTTISEGTTYYWYVYTIDQNNVYTKSSVYSFTVTQPIDVFVGDYNCVEPAEEWDYDVSFVKTAYNKLQIGNGAGTYDGWWASWTAEFTLDLVNNTYSMPLTNFNAGYSGEESGTIDPVTGKLEGTYKVYQDGELIEEGTHTYNKY